MFPWAWGVSILDDYAITTEDTNLSVFDLGDEFPPRNYGLVFRKGKYQPSQVEAFIGSLLAERNKVH